MSLEKYKIVFFGMGGIYSLTPLRALLDKGARVSAVFFSRSESTFQEPRWMPRRAPKDPQALTVLQQGDDINRVAAEYDLPVLEVGALGKEALTIFRDLSPDLVVTACFHHILPQKWLETPRLGCLNIHPSLLPAYRGRNPLFWQFRTGEQDTGVSVHWMDTKVDSGDLLAQNKVFFPEGITAWEADKLIAAAGAELLVDALAKPEMPRHPQPSARASYQPVPSEADRTITADWQVRRAFNFLRGADEWAPFWIELGDGERLEVNQAMEYKLDANLDAPYETKVNDLWVQMSDGVLRLK